MQVVPENLNITNGYQVFETPDALYINNQAYDKFTMESKPYDFFNTNYKYNHKNMLKRQINILEDSYVQTRKDTEYQYFIQDNQDSNIFYCICEQSASTHQEYILKVQKQDNTWKVLKNIAPDTGDPFGWHAPNGPYSSYWSGYSERLRYKFVGQTNNYLVVNQLSCHAAYRAWSSPIGQLLNYTIINKDTMAVTKQINVDQAYDFGTFLIKNIGDSLYLLEHFNGIIRIVRITSSERTVLYADSANQNANSIGVSNIILFQDKYYVLTRNTKTSEEDVDKYAFRILDINFTTNTVTEELKEIEPNEDFPFHIGVSTTDLHDHSWLQITLKNIDDAYIAITTHDCANKNHYWMHENNGGGYDWKGGNGAQNRGANVLSDKGWHRHCLCKYENDQWIIKTVMIPISNTQHIYGVLYYNQYIPIIFYNNGIYIYKLNLNTEQFEILYTKDGNNYYTVGLDENNTLYIFDSNDICETYSKNTVDELKAEFEYEEYNYDNQNINSYIKIYAKNFIKDYIKTKVKLTLTGQCYFTQNNQKELITYTDKNGIKNIPITITYGGALNCDIQELE